MGTIKFATVGGQLEAKRRKNVSNQKNDESKILEVLFKNSIILEYTKHSKGGS